jgi:TRAP-type C4-dicarboxylate transport system permease small subunit
MADLFERFENYVGRFNGVMLGIFKWSVVAVLIIMTSIVFVAVIFRYGLNDALPWSEEIAKFFMVWLTFLAAPVGLSRGSHVAIETLSSYLGGRPRQVVQAFVFMSIIALMVIFVKEGTFLTWNARIQRHSTVDLSILYVYMAMPIGCAATALVAFEYFLGACKGIIDPSRAKERQANYPMIE